MSDNKRSILKYALPIAILAVGIIIGMLVMFYAFVIGAGFIVTSFAGDIHIVVNETAIIQYMEALNVTG